MDYKQLGANEQRQMIRSQIGQLEAKHYAATVNARMAEETRPSDVAAFVQQSAEIERRVAVLEGILAELGPGDAAERAYELDAARRTRPR